MNRNLKMMVIGVVLSCSLASISTFGSADAKVQVRGMIISRTGETLIVNNAQGRTTVVLASDTVTKDDRGLFGLEKEKLGDVVLIPGLKSEGGWRSR